MSLGEGLDTSNLDVDYSLADRRNQSVLMTRSGSMMVNEDHVEKHQRRETSSLPDTTTTCSRWVEQHGVCNDGVPSGDGQEDHARQRKPTMKGLEYRKDTLRERRRKVNSRLIQKYSIIEDLLLLTTSRMVVEEELNQFNDLFKLLLEVHQEYNSLLDDDNRERDNEWFDETDSQACSFKRKVHSWLREAEKKDEASKKSSKGSKSLSKRSEHSNKSKASEGSKSSKSTRSSKSSSKEKEIEERLKVAELLAEASLLQEKQRVNNEIEKLQMRERLVKAKARVRAYNNIEEDKFMEGDQHQIMRDPQRDEENVKQKKFLRREDQGKFFEKEKDDHIKDEKLRQMTSNDAVITCKSESTYRNAWDKDITKRDAVRLRPQKGVVEHSTDDGHLDQNVTKMMCKLLSQQAAPEVDIDMFDGDPMEFHYFMAVFHEAVEKKTDDARGRLTRLIKFTKGEAKDIAKNCIQLPPGVGFKTAK